jgi:AAA domain/Bifunctional DNA primase/polymerase, N-terminal
MNALLDAALAYASERSWRVFPISPETKVPYPGTHGFHDASSDPDVIRAWWSVTPDAWIGLALRPSGLIAVDVDVGEGKDGAATLSRLEKKFGTLPRDLVQRSHRGGEHILMLDPSPGPAGWTRTAAEGGSVRGKADALGCGANVDFKVSGYVLLHPSGKYHWETFGDAPPVPEGWIAALRKPALEGGAAPDADGLEDWAASSDPAPLPAADRERLRADLRALGPRASGKSTTFAAVLRIFHDYGLSLEDGYPLILEWNSQCGTPRDEHDLHRQIRNIAEGGRAQGKRGNKRSDLSRLQAIVRAAFDHRAIDVPAAPGLEVAVVDAPAPAPIVPALPPPCAPEPQAAPNPNPDYHAQLELAAEELAIRTAADAQEVASLVPMFETARALRARSYPPTPWMINGLVPTLGTGGVAGEPKTSKSWCCTEMAIAVVTATPAFGKFTVARPGRVAYFYAEDVGPSVQTRINALTAGRANMAPGWDERLIVQPRGRSIDLTKDIDIVQIIASVRMFGPVDLLVLDPLRDLHSGEEDSSDAMIVVLKRMAIIGDILGCMVMFVHHSAKASSDSGKRRGGQRMRGSGAIHGKLDCGMYLFDLRGDGKTEFINGVESEMKSARSAGTFDLKLNIVDNAHGIAERATWTVGEHVATAPKNAPRPEPTLGEVLMMLFDHGAPMITPTITAKLKGSTGHVIGVLAAATREGFVERALNGTVDLGIRLTDKGRKAVQQGSSGNTEAPPAPHPATAGICNLPPEEK